MVSKQVCWEEVDIGQDIPTLVKCPTHIQMLMWGGAVDDYNPMHADNKIAERAGYKEPIVFGPLVFSFLVQMITSWMGPDGWLQKIKVRHNAPAFAGDEIVFRGRITNKYTRDKEHCVELEIEADYPSIERGTVGSAVVILPTKAEAHPVPAGGPLLSTPWLSIRPQD